MYTSWLSLKSMHQKGIQNRKKVTGGIQTLTLQQLYLQQLQGGALPAELFIAWLAVECG